MGKPAARMGDTTMHGGSIVVGAPTVLIGGMPAARANDMHVCPMLNPGVPPPPHVGGPILLGSPTVLICGAMAARMGDMAQCSGPPDTIAAGCPTVLIGEMSGGGGGAPGSGGGSAGETGVEPNAVAQASAATSGGGGGDQEPAKGETHFLDVSFVDKGGFPIEGVRYQVTAPDGDKAGGSLNGPVRQNGIAAGSYEIELMAIVAAAWSKSEARPGDLVKLTAEVIGVPSGTDAVFKIWERDINSADDLVTRIEAKTRGTRVEAEWEYEYREDEDEPQEQKTANSGYSDPEYYFTIEVEGEKASSGLLRFKDYIEISLTDEDDNPVPDQEYIVCLSNGEVRKGKLDKDGYAKVENVPPAGWSVRFPDGDDLYEDD